MIHSEACLLRTAFAQRFGLGAVDDGVALTTASPPVVRYQPLAALAVSVVMAVTLLAATAVFPQPLPVVMALAVALAVTRAAGEAEVVKIADALSDTPPPPHAVGIHGVLAAIAVLGLKAVALGAMDVMSAARVAMAAASVGALVSAAAQALQAAGVRPLDLALAALLAAIVGLIAVSPVTLATASAFALLVTAALAAATRQRRGNLAPTGPGRAISGAAAQVAETAFMLMAAGVVSGPG